MTIPTDRDRIDAIARFCGIEDMARGQVSLGGSSARTPLPLSDDFVNTSFSFKNAGGTWLVAEIGTAKVFRGSISGASVAKVTSGSGTWDVPIGWDSGNGNISVVHKPRGSWDFANATISSLIIENRTSDPGSPVSGQIWLRTDL